jgi:hypothetical protein
MSKKPNGTKLNKNVMTWLAEQHGGEEEILAEYGVSRIVELGAEGATVAEITAAGEKEGWGEAWAALSMGELVELFDPPKGRKGSGSRAPRVPVAVVAEATLESMRGIEAPITMEKLVKASEYGDRVKGAVRHLMNEGKVTRTGSRANSTYSLV